MGFAVLRAGKDRLTGFGPAGRHPFFFVFLFIHKDFFR